MTNRRSGRTGSVFERGVEGWAPTRTLGIGPMGAQDMGDLEDSQDASNADDAWIDFETEDRFAPLRVEHSDLRARIQALRTFVGTDEERLAHWNSIATALEAHAQAEEELLYPRLEGLGGVGKMAKGALLGHKRMRELALKIEAKGSDDPDYPDLLDELERVSRHHVELEEHFLMPLAEQVLGRGEVDAIVNAYVERRRQVEPVIADRRTRSIREIG